MKKKSVANLGAREMPKHIFYDPEKSMEENIKDAIEFEKFYKKWKKDMEG